MAGKSEKSAVVLVAEGTEEMELVIAADVLRRAGIAVTVAGVEIQGNARGENVFPCSRGVLIKADVSLQDALLKSPYHAIVLPGGLAGSETFSKSAEVGCLLKEQEKTGGLIAAICAAPLALKAHGIGIGKSITCYPSVKDRLGPDYKYIEESVVLDGNLLTSQGPGTAFSFALRISEELIGKEKAESVKKELLL